MSNNTFGMMLVYKGKLLKRAVEVEKARQSKVFPEFVTKVCDHPELQDIMCYGYIMGLRDAAELLQKEETTVGENVVSLREVDDDPNE